MTYRDRFMRGAPPEDEPPTVAAILNRIANRALEHERAREQSETLEALEALEALAGGRCG